MSKAYWLIQGYDSLNLIFEKRVDASYFSNEQMKSLLKALIAKAGLTFDEVLGGYARRRSRIANDHLDVRGMLSRILRAVQIHTLLHVSAGTPLVLTDERVCAGSDRFVAGRCFVAALICGKDDPRFEGDKLMYRS